MVFGFFGKKDEVEEEGEDLELEPVSFLGPVSGQDASSRPG